MPNMRGARPQQHGRDRIDSDGTARRGWPGESLPSFRRGLRARSISRNGAAITARRRQARILANLKLEPGPETRARVGLA